MVPRGRAGGEALARLPRASGGRWNSLASGFSSASFPHERDGPAAKALTDTETRFSPRERGWSLFDGRRPVSRRIFSRELGGPWWWSLARWIDWSFPRKWVRAVPLRA
ncbi:hypothetical protein GCM10010185_43080 [Saccharothrix coeruleofusca]|uniref:Uncharacterized protein n=1 Tax=Saccharothrix coeruleofusca TaxID=33919 RepID=A0A918AP68_9PSEU|nr:hypothetical protein GCM10010185_43080 [Saccharothrix coeruleofusca]